MVLTLPAILLKGFKNRSLDDILNGIKNFDEFMFQDPVIVTAFTKCLPSKDDVRMFSDYFNIT